MNFLSTVLQRGEQSIFAYLVINGSIFKELYLEESLMIKIIGECEYCVLNRLQSTKLKVSNEDCAQGMYSVRCPRCKQRGPEGVSPQHAILLHNAKHILKLDLLKPWWKWW